MTSLSDPQRRVLEFAAENGYIAPGSFTHARLTDTTGSLHRTVRALRDAGLLRLGKEGRCYLTERGQEMVPARGLTEKWWDR
jgi:predicted transcriptional regulator